MRKLNMRMLMSYVLIMAAVLMSAFTYTPAEAADEGDLSDKVNEYAEAEYFSMTENDLPYTSPTGWKVRHRGNYKYGEYVCGDFMVFPDIYEDVTSPEIYYQGFCVDHHKSEMRNSSNVLEISEIQYEKVLKVLYYGFRDEKGYYGTVLGAKYPYMSAEKRAYSVVCMDMALDTIYNGSPHEVSDNFLEWCDAQPAVPTGELAFYNDNGDAFINGVAAEYFDYERNETIHATSWINVKGSDTLACEIAELPNEISLYMDNCDGTTTKYSSGIKLKNGDRFFLGAPITYSGAYSTELIYEEAPYKAYITNMGEGYQRVAALMMGMSKGAGFNVSFSQAVGNVFIKKSPLVEEIVRNNANYSCKGAKYAVFGDGVIAAEIVIGDDDIGVAGNIPCGKWYVQETQASPGYEKDKNIYEVEVLEGETVEVAADSDNKQVYENPVSYNAKLLLQKTDMRTNKLLEGAEFEIKFFNVCMDGNPEDMGYKHDRIWLFKTDENGEIYFDEKHKIGGDDFFHDKDNNVTLPLGTITIKETKAPQGYKKDSTINYVKIVRKEDITAQGEVIYSAVMTATPIVPNDKILYPIDIVVYKEPENDSFPIETIKDAEYTVKYYDDIYNIDSIIKNNLLFEEKNGNVTLGDNSILNEIMPERSWVLKTDENGFAKMDEAHKVSGDNFYYSDNNEAVLPMGMVTIQETKAPEGFLIDPNIYVGLWDDEAEAYNMVSVKTENKVIDAFAHVYEKEELKGKIAIEKTGDKYIYDRETNSFNKKNMELEGITFDVFAADEIYKSDGTAAYKKGDLVESIVTNADGYAETGFLYLGQYTVSEKTPEGYYPSNDIEVILDKSKETVDVTGDGVTSKVVYEFLQVNNVPIIPEISTTAESNGNKIAIADSITKVTDHVTISNLIEGREYIVHGTIMNKKTGAPLVVDGQPVTSDEIFVCNAKDMTVDVEFNINAYELAGNDIVVFEELIYDGEVIAVHKDINDEGQTIKFPQIRTYAVDSDTGNKSLSMKENAVIKDTISYSNLISGMTYTIRGVLMDVSTGSPLVIEDDSVITSGISFVPEETHGTIDVEFIIDTRKIKGKSLVVFEELYCDNYLIASHCDINDENQTLYVPEISTTARDKISGSNFSTAAKTINIVDNISYRNLVPGVSYVIKGTIVNGINGNPIPLENNDNCVEKSFVPENPDGSVDVEFVIDASDMGGINIVVFEELYCEGELVAEHMNIDDEKQTIYFPVIKTMARDKETNRNISNPKEKVSIIDKVMYDGLIAGKTYELTGILMDKASNEPILDVNGCEIVSKKEFVPETGSGEIEVEFIFDASLLIGKTVVVFENLWCDGKEIAVHTDINDDTQSVRFPFITTEATESNSGTRYTMPRDELTINDKVIYHNLCTDVEYTINGILMDKSTGKPLYVDGKEITSTLKFTPKSENGVIDINYSFNSTGMINKEIVVFEEMCIDDTVVCIHEDLDDERQTICITDNPKTGDNKKPICAIIIAVISLGAIIILLKNVRFVN